MPHGAIDFNPKPTNRNHASTQNDAMSGTAASADRSESRPGLSTSMSPLAAPNATAPASLLRQIRARLAFQRASTRLYEALLAKLDAGSETEMRSQRGALNRTTLLRFRTEEAANFELLCESLVWIGVDPVTDLNRESQGEEAALDAPVPRAGIMNAAEALDALLDVELTDEAGWQRLVATAHACGLADLAHRFEQAHSVEIGHVRQLRAWSVMLPAAQRRVA
jgi:hypothetical protein